MLLLLALLMSAVPAGASAPAALLPPDTRASVDDQVWRDLAASPDHLAVFSVVLHEPPTGVAHSLISAQMDLESTLALLQRLGSIASYTVEYGVNAVQVKGSRAVLHLLAGWPSVAALRAYSSVETPLQLNQPPAAGEATGEITGQVTGPGGATPLSGIRVTAYRQTGATTWTQAGMTFTDSSGVYAVGGLVTGIYRARFDSTTGAYVTEFYNDKPTFALATNFNVTDGQTTAGIDASLAQAGSIAGRVTDVETGENVADIVVTAWIQEGATWRQAGSALTASNGLYTMGGLAGGQSYRVKFGDPLIPPRYLEEYYDNVTTLAAATPVPVVGGQTTPNIDAALGSYGKISGRVTGPDGVTGLADIVVDVYEFNPSLGQWQWVSGDSTTSSGAYLVDGLVTDAYRVFFSDPAGHFMAEYYDNKPDLLSADDVPVQLGLVTAGIDASLARPCYYADVYPNANHNLPDLCDGVVSVADVQRVAGCWLVSIGLACPATLDLNGDGVIDLLDIINVGEEWGWPDF